DEVDRAAVRAGPEREPDDIRGLAELRGRCDRQVSQIAAKFAFDFAQVALVQVSRPFDRRFEARLWGQRHRVGEEHARTVGAGALEADFLDFFLFGFGDFDATDWIVQLERFAFGGVPHVQAFDVFARAFFGFGPEHPRAVRRYRVAHVAADRQRVSERRAFRRFAVGQDAH